MMSGNSLFLTSVIIGIHFIYCFIVSY